MMRRGRMEEEEEAGTHGEGQDGGQEGSLIVARQLGQDAVQDGGKLQEQEGKGQRLPPDSRRAAAGERAERHNRRKVEESSQRKK